MKLGIKILPRQNVLDKQGRTVEKTLNENDFSVQKCRVGKYIEIDVESKDFDDAKTKVKAMADYVLYNPLVEDYTIEVID